MIKVLHIMGGTDIGGISRVILNYYEYMDREKIHFDIAVKSKPGNDARMFISMGSKVYRLPLKSKHPLKYVRVLKGILDNNAYDVLHTNEGITGYLALAVARMSGVKKRIVHSHAANGDLKFHLSFKTLLSLLFTQLFATQRIACGKAAAISAFGEINYKKHKVIIIPNAIDIQKFKYDSAAGKILRRKYSLENSYVLGMVARISKEKNIDFSIDLVERLVKSQRSIKLVIIGDGEEKERIEGLVENKGLSAYVMFLGKRIGVEKYYSMMDLFLMPSLKEGFPVAAVEAVAAGLPVLISNHVTDELKFAKNVHYLSLSEMDQWVEMVDMYAKKKERVDNTKQLKKHDLDIQDVSNKLYGLYL